MASTVWCLSGNDKVFNGFTLPSLFCLFVLSFEDQLDLYLICPNTSLCLLHLRCKLLSPVSCDLDSDASLGIASGVPKWAVEPFAGHTLALDCQDNQHNAA